MTITGRNATLIIIDESNVYLSNGEALANIRALLEALKKKEARSMPPEGMSLYGDYSVLELKVMAHTTESSWTRKKPKVPSKKPKGPRNRWGGLK